MSIAAERLARLESYLAEDPANLELLAEACDTATTAGLHAQALKHLEAGQRAASDKAPWTWRRARLAIAQRRLDVAATCLEELEPLVGRHPAVTHDRAYVHLLQRDFDACRALVFPWLRDAAAGEHADALQALWLRATHAAGLVQEAWDWVQNGQKLGPQAAAVASLVAVDVGEFAVARTSADSALASRPIQEALVARATVALAEGDGAGAGRLLLQALEQNPDDGRAWSVLGMCSLRQGDLSRAQSQLERAVSLMPGHIGTWHALGWTHVLQRQLEQARRAFDQALALDESFAESHGAVGLVLAMQGGAAAGARQLAIAARLDPRNVTGRYAQALLAGETADRERLQGLVLRLLDRPGLFGGRLAEDVLSAVHPDE